MERLADKTVALVACLPALARAAEGSVGAALVTALLAVVISAAVGELAPGRSRAAGALALAALACALPEAAALLGVAAYDLVFVAAASQRPPARALPLAAPAALAVSALAHGTSGPQVLLAICGIVVGATLGLRAARANAERARSRAVRDDLAATELALARRNRELVDAQGQEAALATLAERARIAREIHDHVGHLLTRAVVQAEALRVVHEGDAVEVQLGGVADTLREALDEVRASVHDLRDDACDLSVQVRAAVAEACSGTGLEARVRVDAGSAPAPVTACLLAVTREALSNVLRHADARAVTVELVEHPALWRITVADDGAGAGVPGAGMGLATMEERVRALGGTFRAGPGEGGGWVVFASVPRDAAARGEGR